MFGFPFEPKIDIGHFLTFITLVLGFLGAGYNALKSWRKKAEEDAKSGALRLLLHILRERGSPISLPDLMAEFEAPARTEQRKAYCGSDWHFKNKETFESAVYQLDLEGKIDFVSPHEIVFRLDRQHEVYRKFSPDSTDTQQLLTILRGALTRPNGHTWDLRDIAESCMRVDPQATCALLQDLLHNSKDPVVQERVAAIIGRFVPETPTPTSNIHVFQGAAPQRGAKAP